MSYHPTLRPFNFQGATLGRMYSLLQTEKLTQEKKKKILLNSKKASSQPMHTVDDLIKAITAGNENLIFMLLRKGVPLNKMNRAGKLPLTHALEQGQYTLAAILETRGADPLKMDRVGRTALGMAWFDSVGGRNRNQKPSRPASRLLNRWQRIYGYKRANEMFSPAYQHQNLSPTLQTQLDISTRLLDVSMPSNVNALTRKDWELALDPEDALERRKDQIKRNNPTTNLRPKMNMGRMF